METQLRTIKHKSAATRGNNRTFPALRINCTAILTTINKVVLFRDRPRRDKLMAVDGIDATDTELAFAFDSLWCFGQPLHLESVGRLEECGKLFLRHVHLSGVHELQDGLQVAERNVFQDDDRVFRRVFL